MDIITLLTQLADGFLNAQDEFYDHPDRFADMEKTVADLSHKTAAQFLTMALSGMDDILCHGGAPKQRFTTQRHDTRTLITTVGDVTFTHTLFEDRSSGKTCYLLDELLHLPGRERFSSQAEARVLTEAQVHSYQHAADSLQIGNQKVSRTAVMSKVHSITEELLPEPELPETEKKHCDYLYIEADEDHIHSQQDPDNRNGMIGKLIYIFEGKDSVGKGRHELVFPHYHGGLYQGSAANARLWTEVDQYIRNHYDLDSLKKVYISGDGGGWIKAGTDYVGKSEFVADRFHLMKYINRVSRCTLDSADETKARFYKYIYKNKPVAAKKLLTRIQNHCDGSDRAVEECRSFLINNWDAIQRAFHDKHVLGCSAEGHVSHVYSDRMSSRPMGWSVQGSDRMCRLRCFVRNHGSERVIDLVRYRREKVFREQHLAATGTDGAIIEQEVRKRRTKAQKELAKYYDALQVTIGSHTGTVRKTFAIRYRLNEI